MRVLIAGGGVAGLTLAAKLRQQGRVPLVVERAREYGEAGYGISLYPLGSCVLHGLGVYDQFIARGVQCRRYEIADHAGQPLQSADVSVFTDDVGPMVMLSRTALIDVLRQACAELPVRMGITVTSIDQTVDVVRVVFSDGSTQEFDLVIGCEGIHSPVRAQAIGEPETFDTGWTLWTWWGPDGLFASDSIREFWGRAYFFGAYPIPGRCMFAAGLPNEAVEDPGAGTEAIRPQITGAFRELIDRVNKVRLAFKDAVTLFAWPMIDVRSHKWYSGRVALCGDAAAAFLPTAGVGASIALRSAAALADELSRTDAEHVELALELYVKRCRKRVWGAQDDSRSAARYVFVESKALGWGRDQLVKHYPMRKVVSQIIESMRQPF
jgi:2-polyprenyl-6-methoxyphenol hydroxylase-like FAD-dependent oxidoreductase